jgi:CysZ protein
MFRAFSLSVGQLFDRPALRVFVMSLALTLAIFVVLGGGSVYAARSIALAYDLGESGAFAAAAATALLAIGGAWLLFRAVAIAVIGLFGDQIVSAVEERHYPTAASAARPVSLGRSARMGLQSALRAILFNLLALPVYGILLVTGVGTVVLFAAVNALLLGRDLGEMVAARHMATGEMPAWLAATRLQRALMGLVVTGLFVVPVANLFAPIIGAAMATHLFHGRRA